MGKRAQRPTLAPGEHAPVAPAGMRAFADLFDEHGEPLQRPVPEPAVSRYPRSTWECPDRVRWLCHSEASHARHLAPLDLARTATGWTLQSTWRYLGHDPEIRDALLANPGLPADLEREIVISHLSNGFSSWTYQRCSASPEAREAFILSVLTEADLRSSTLYAVACTGRLLSEEAALALCEHPKCTDAIAVAAVASSYLRRPEVAQVFAAFGSETVRVAAALAPVRTEWDPRRLLKAARAARSALRSERYDERFETLSALAVEWHLDVHELVRAVRALA